MTPDSRAKSTQTRTRPKRPDPKQSMHDIRAITVDLDDTLWPIGPVIEVAERSLYRWLAVNCPRSVRRHTVDSMREARTRVAKTEKGIAYDVTEVRRRSLMELIVEQGAYPSKFVDDAMAEFLKHRNRVELYPDVLPFLNRTKARFPLLSISNGNADLHQIGLGDLFSGHISAGKLGAAKPDSKLFRAACDLLELAPEQVLHIGDHPIEDILGASQVGMKTVWINRTGTPWDEEHSADYEVTSLEQVLDLLPLRGPGDSE